MSKVKIFTLIGQEIVRLGLRTLLLEADDFSIVGEGESLASLDHAIAKFSPDIVILDFYHSQDETIDAIKRLKRTYPGIKILIYTNDDSEEIFFRAYHSGADGFLLRTTDVNSVVDALKTLKGGELFFGPQISELMLKRFLRPHRRRLPARPRSSRSVKSKF
jgi:DNA-binding NarL/FixJ family response regulator